MTAPTEGALMLCARVLAAARAEEWGDVSALVSQLAAEHGADGQMTLVYGLADKLAEKLGASWPRRGTVAPLWQAEGSGEVTGADDVAPEAAWAGRFIAARVAWDRDACNALLGAVPDDATWSRNVSALISMTALTLTRLEAEAAT